MSPHMERWNLVHDIFNVNDKGNIFELVTKMDKFKLVMPQTTK